MCMCLELNIPKTTIMPSPNYFEPVKPARKKPSHKVVHNKEKHQGNKKKGQGHGGGNTSGEDGEDVVAGAGTTLEARTDPPSPYAPSRPPPWILHHNEVTSGQPSTATPSATITVSLIWLSSWTL